MVQSKHSALQQAGIMLAIGGWSSTLVSCSETKTASSTTAPVSVGR